MSRACCAQFVLTFSKLHAFSGTVLTVWHSSSERKFLKTLIWHSWHKCFGGLRSQRSQVRILLRAPDLARTAKVAVLNLCSLFPASRGVSHA